MAEIPDSAFQKNSHVARISEAARRQWSAMILREVLPI
jgi:hypothetical protein